MPFAVARWSDSGDGLERPDEVGVAAESCWDGDVGQACRFRDARMMKPPLLFLGRSSKVMEIFNVLCYNLRNCLKPD